MGALPPLRFACEACFVTVYDAAIIGGGPVELH